jgi:hypothetical protein
MSCNQPTRSARRPECILSNTANIITVITITTTIGAITMRERKVRAGGLWLKVFTAFSLLCGAVAFADEPLKTVSLSDATPAAQKTIQAQVGNGTMGNINETPADGETVYEVDLTAKDGTDRDFSVADDGTLLSVEVEAAEIPAPAQTTVKTLVGDGDLDSIDKNLDDLEMNYDVDWTTKDGRDKSATITGDGTLMSIEVSTNEIPATVKATIMGRMGGGTVNNLYENFDDSGTNFDVEIKRPDGRKNSFTVEMDGSLTSMEINITQVPPGALKSIQERMGDGKILRIDKSFVRRAGVLPYEVQGRKDGKPFDFSVGPRGRFLGMDD